MGAATKSAGRLGKPALYRFALRALSRRSHTLAELEAKLVRRCRREEDVGAVVTQMQQHGYLNDERVAEAHIELRRDHARFGQRRVLSELRRRGVDRALAERVVRKGYGNLDETELASEFLKRKLAALPGVTEVNDRKTLLRLHRALARAGFGPSASASALRAVSSNDEMLDLLEEASVAG